MIVTIFTELFGVQSYMVNGVRTSTKKGTGKAMLFQPSAMLDMVVYHSETKTTATNKRILGGDIYTSIYCQM
ncbi:MAG: recombination protein O N-terminal domain-containing protein [Bacteroidota bacterium]